MSKKSQLIRDAFLGIGHILGPRNPQELFAL